MPLWGGPALIPDIDATGVTAMFPPQTFKVARFRVRRKVEAKDAVRSEDSELDPMRVRS